MSRRHVVRVVRASWGLHTVLTVGAVVWLALEPIGQLSLSCSKGWVLSEPATLSGATCDTRLFHALETERFALLAALVIVPPLIAAACSRVWVSVAAVAALVLVTGYGLGHWSTYWVGLAMLGAPVTFLGLIVTLMHIAVNAREQSLRPIPQ